MPDDEVNRHRGDRSAEPDSAPVALARPALMRRMQPATASFDRLAIHYDRFGWLVGREVFAYLTECLPQRERRAADLGCGTGRHAAELEQRFDEILAVDVSAPMLALAQRHRAAPNITYALRDLRNVTAEHDGTFDLVFSAFTLHHLPDIEAALRQIRALVRPGGQVILLDLCDVPHDRRWFHAEARRTLVRDVLGRRRPLREARELYRLSTDPAWLDHQVADRPLRPGQFEQIYGATFHSATFTTMYRARAMHWQASA
jgi:ubiquinone/menaquinone biosynthesis C-methylase UbiE